MIRTPNLVLIGFMGVGKSSVGRKCAQKLGYPYHDTDQWIVRHVHKPIPQIFSEDGEAAFRELEREAVRLLAMRSAIVLSTGGGAVLDPENATMLRESGVVVLLTASTESIMERVGGRTNRPLLQCEDPQARVTELLAMREPVYRSVAHAVVDTSSRDLDEVAREVLSHYRSRSA